MKSRQFVAGEEGPLETEVFDNRRGKGDDAYQAWLRRHPEGFVLNTSRKPDPAYMVLHRATCQTITKPTRSTSADPFTGEGYIKVCAMSRGALLAWVGERGGSDFSSRCGHCCP